MIVCILYVQLSFIFLPNSLPLEIMCDDSMQGSKEAALSITKLTPSPSSASSSDSCDMTSPDFSADSTPSANRPGLLTTIEDHNSTLQISDLHLVLNSTESSPSVGKVLNTSQESMDCHNNSHDREAILAQLGSMDLDSPITNSNELSLAWSSTPDFSPIHCARSTVHRLASTPEGRCSTIYSTFYIALCLSWFQARASGDVGLWNVLPNHCHHLFLILVSACCWLALIGSELFEFNSSC